MKYNVITLNSIEWALWLVLYPVISIPLLFSIWLDQVKLKGQKTKKEFYNSMTVSLYLYMKKDIFFFFFFCSIINRWPLEIHKYIHISTFMMKIKWGICAVYGKINNIVYKTCNKANQQIFKRKIKWKHKFRRLL